MMWKARWWTIDTVFVAVIGVAMAVVLGASFLVRMGSNGGNRMVPAHVLEEIREHERTCRTLTDQDLDVQIAAGVRFRRC